MFGSSPARLARILARPSKRLPMASSARAVRVGGAPKSTSRNRPCGTSTRRTSRRAEAFTGSGRWWKISVGVDPGEVALGLAGDERLQQRPGSAAQIEHRLTALDLGKPGDRCLE